MTGHSCWASSSDGPDAERCHQDNEHARENRLMGGRDARKRVVHPTRRTGVRRPRGRPCLRLLHAPGRHSANGRARLDVRHEDRCDSDQADDGRSRECQPVAPRRMREHDSDQPHAEACEDAVSTAQARPANASASPSSDRRACRQERLEAGGTPGTPAEKQTASRAECERDGPGTNGQNVNAVADTRPAGADPVNRRTSAHMHANERRKPRRSAALCAAMALPVAAKHRCAEDPCHQVQLRVRQRACLRVEDVRVEHAG